MIRFATLAFATALAAAPAAFAQDAAAPPPPVAGGVVASQPVPNPPGSRPDTQAESGYTGDAHGAAFLDIDARIAALSAQAKGGKAAAAVKAIKGEELVRRKRNGGELRDFDREVLNKRLDAVQAMVGAA